MDDFTAGFDWDELRAEALPPAAVSEPNGTDREGFLAGCVLAGLIGRQLTLKPHQLLVPEVLDAGYTTNAVLMPRRSTKSTTMVAWMLGRCMARPDYLVAYIYATTAKKARTRFLQDIVPMVTRNAGRVALGFKIMRNAGMERIIFDNGSIFAIIAPRGDDLRSDAWDLIVIDEAGEADPAKGEDMLSAALPTMDTRPGSQLVVTGTAGRYRRGNLLWDQLEDGRAGRGGILEYSAPDTLTADDTDDWPTMAAILETCHPGIASGLTTMDVMLDRWRKMKRSLFLGEYCSIFGDIGGGGGVIVPAKWQKAGIPFVFSYPDPPERFGLAVSVTPGLTFGAIVAAWREDDGTGRLLLLDHHEGIRWMPARAAELSKKYRLPITHDNFGSVMVVIEEIMQLKPRPQLDPQTTRGVTTAAGKLVEQLETGRVFHYEQDELTAAALIARKRTIGPKAWAFGRQETEDDIAALEAAALALRAFDELPTRQKISILRPTG